MCVCKKRERERERIARNEPDMLAPSDKLMTMTMDSSPSGSFDSSLEEPHVWCRVDWRPAEPFSTDLYKGRDSRSSSEISITEEESHGSVTDDDLIKISVRELNQRLQVLSIQFYSFIICVRFLSSAARTRCCWVLFL